MVRMEGAVGDPSVLGVVDLDRGGRAGLELSETDWGDLVFRKF
jgi:hypothetical protein